MRIIAKCNCGEVATEHCNVHGDHLRESVEQSLRNGINSIESALDTANEMLGQLRKTALGPRKLAEIIYEKAHIKWSYEEAIQAIRELLASAVSEREALIHDMYEELKPGPTGGNDYHDAWQVFGERLTALERPAPTAKESEK